MHKIDRNSAPIPLCLSTPCPERRYSDLYGVEKEEIRVSLLTIQKHRCAYCERRTGPDSNDGHIEHFKKQADNPNLDLTWTNMFWSCNDEKTCGKSKDKCERPSGRKAIFNPDDLINPCIDDPDEFFLFVTDGTVQLKENLSGDNKQRANETLRVFQLSESAYLRKAREDAVKPYLNAIETLAALAGPAIVRQYVQSEIAKLEDAPFSTVIHHFFRSYCP